MIVCKVCGATNEQGATFCGTCGSFLEWSGEAVQPDGSTQPQAGADGPPPGPTGPSGAPNGDASTGDSTAIVTPIVATAETVPPGSIICPNCGQANDPTRVYCSRCATELAPVVAATDQVVAAPPTSRSIPPIAIAGVIGAVALLAIFAFVLLPKGSPAPSSEAAVTEVPSAVVASNPPSTAASGSPAASASGGVEAPSPSSEASPALRVPTGRIAFQARTNGNTDMMVWSADTGAIVKLAGGKGDQSEPAWDPDGKRIVYVENIPPFSPNGGTPDEGLRVVKDDGSPASVFDFTHHDVDRNPAWSPDGATIVFSSTRDHTQNKNLDIYSRIYEATTTENLLVDSPADDWDPAWSPDGNRIVFVSKRNGDDHLFTMRPNGNGQVALKLGNGVFDDPVFSPDGQKLAFTRRDNANAQKQLFVANADGSDMTQVGSFDADVSDPTWSPDSAMIALTRGIPGAMIVIVDAETGAQVAEFGVDGASIGQADWR